MQLIDLLDRNREPYFICVGSANCLLDSVACRVGSKLLDNGFNVIGTMDSPLHALNINKRYKEEIELIDTIKYQLIAVDCMLDDKYGGKDKIFIQDTPIRPGKALNKDLKEVGEISIGINAGYNYKSWEECLLDMIANRGNIEDVNHLSSETFRYIMNTLTDLESEKRNVKREII